ncbi:Thioesterase/thiol ester dehydrase-isomerase [Gloeopeniophorella convolvens]|nr:Thioesterase/thiol ester dehydrase-isomerase [Gloeopeniophorella convolvens]
MSDRSPSPVAPSSSASVLVPAEGTPGLAAMGPGAQHWVDPQALPDSEYNIGDIAGNVPDYAKRLACNTFVSYGIGSEDAFGVWKAFRVTEMTTQRNVRHGDRLEAVVTCELVVQKSMVNGAGAVHGGCVAYLIDNCASLPLVVLGILQDINGVGVTQNLQVSYHAPALVGMRLLIVCTSVVLGKRVMNARCEISEKKTGRPVASGFISKMQPLPAAAKL